MSLRQKMMRRIRGVMMNRLPGMITCRAFDEFIVDYLEESLPEKDRVLFERHIRFCPDCERYLGRYRLALAAGERTLSDMDEPVPEELVEAVLAAVTSREP